MTLKRKYAYIEDWILEEPKKDKYKGPNGDPGPKGDGATLNFKIDFLLNVGDNWKTQTSLASNNNYLYIKLRDNDIVDCFCLKDGDNKEDYWRPSEDWAKDSLDYFRIWAKMYGKRIEESKVTKDNMTYPRTSYEVEGWEKVTICYVETTLYYCGYVTELDIKQWDDKRKEPKGEKGDRGNDAYIPESVWDYRTLANWKLD